MNEIEGLARDDAVKAFRKVLTEGLNANWQRHGESHWFTSGVEEVLAEFYDRIGVRK